MPQVHPNAPYTLRKLTIAIALALPAFSSSLPVWAADTRAQNTAHPQTATLKFNIPAQPLVDALNAFIAASDWQVGFPAGMAKDVRSSAVNGSYTPQQALQQLLSGSGLSYRVTGANTVTLEKTPEQLNKANPATLKPMTVKGKRDYDPNDPYNTDYNRTNASTATKTDTPKHQRGQIPLIVNAQVTLKFPDGDLGALVGGGGGGRQIVVPKAHIIGIAQRRDSKAGEGRALGQCSCARAALAGMACTALPIRRDELRVRAQDSGIAQLLSQMRNTRS